MARLVPTGVALLLLSTVACTGGDAPIVEETLGSLGWATFRWRCVHDSDPTCGTGVFPSAVAVGSRFGLEVLLSGELPDEVQVHGLQPASPSLLTGSGSALTAVRAGEVGVMALGEDYVIDYLDLRLAPVDRIEVAAGGSESLGLQPGNRIAVRGIAFFSSSRLGGALEYTWTSSADDVLGVDDLEGANADLVGRREGTAQLSISAGGFTQVVPVRVEAPAPLPPPATTGDSVGSGSDSGSGSDTGSGEGTGSGSDTGSSEDTGSGTDTGSGSGSESGSGSSTGESTG